MSHVDTSTASRVVFISSIFRTQCVTSTCVALIGMGIERSCASLYLSDYEKKVVFSIHFIPQRRAHIVFLVIGGVELLSSVCTYLYIYGKLTGRSDFQKYSQFSNVQLL